MKKGILKKIILSLVALLVLITTVLVVMFNKELQTISTIKKVDQYPLYEMTYKGDYGFDKLLKKGASNDKELVQFISTNLLKGLPIKIKVPDLGCATFTATTPKGDHLFGRNFDLDYSPSMLVRTKPDHGYQSISMVNLAFLGYKKDSLDHYSKRLLALAAPYIPLDGMNEKGLSVGVLQLKDKPTNQNTKKVDLTTTAAIRLLLDHAANVPQAIKLLRNYDMHSSAHSCYHLQIADASGKSAVIEYINNKFTVIYPKDKFQEATNFYLAPGKKYGIGHGQDRYNVMQKVLKNKDGILTKSQAMNLLATVHKDETTHKKYEGIANTQWSAVYNNTDRSLNLAINHNYNKVYHFKFN